MPQFQPIQQSFSHGEQSPRLIGRTGSEHYREAVAYCRNFVPLSHGPMTFRPGMRFVDELNETDDNLFLVPFQIDANTPTCVVIGENWVQVFGNNGAIAGAQFTSPYAGFDRSIIQFDELPNSRTIWMAHPNVAPYQLDYDGANFTFIPTPLQNAPAVWTGTNWPGAITFHQQRSWFGGTPNEGETFWSSQTGDYGNFDQGSAQPDEALQYTLARRGRISWLRGARNLVVGTETAEYIALSEGAVLKPGDIDLRQQSAYGSSTGQVEAIGDRIIYASGDGTKLRTMAYEWLKDAWTSVDMAWVSEHLTQATITRIGYERDPEQTIWLSLKDNPEFMLTCSFNREQNVIGWAHHRTEGEYLTMCVGVFGGLSVVWNAVKRTVEPGPAQKIYLEQNNRDHFLDSYVHYNSPTETNVVPGLDHLEGQFVTCTIDGGVHPLVQVIGGQITTLYGGNDFYVGYGYAGFMLTLPLEGGVPRGTMQGVMKRWNKVWLRLVNSVRPRIDSVPFWTAFNLLWPEPDDQTLVSAITAVARPPTRSPSTPMTTPEPPTYEDVQVGNVGHDFHGAIFVSHELPLPCTISAIFGELEEGTI